MNWQDVHSPAIKEFIMKHAGIKITPEVFQNAFGDFKKLSDEDKFMFILWEISQLHSIGARSIRL